MLIQCKTSVFEIKYSISVEDEKNCRCKSHTCAHKAVFKVMGILYKIGT